MSKLTRAECSWSHGGARTTWGTGHTLRPAVVRGMWAPLGALGAPWGNEGRVTQDRVYPNPRPKAGTKTSLCPAESEQSPPQRLEPCFPESVPSGDLEEKEGRGERPTATERWGNGERKEKRGDGKYGDGTRKEEKGKGEEEEKERGEKGREVGKGREKGGH